MKGTTKAEIPTLNEVTDVAIGLAPDIPAAA